MCSLKHWKMKESSSSIPDQPLERIMHLMGMSLLATPFLLCTCIIFVKVVRRCTGKSAGVYILYT